MVENKKLYTIKEISELSGITEDLIMRLIILKRLHAVRIGKALRVTESDFESFIKDFIAETKNTDIDLKETTGKYPVLYTVEQVSKILQLSTDNVLLLLKSKKLKGFKIREGRSSWRITAQNLAEYIESRSRANA